MRIFTTITSNKQYFLNEKAVGINDPSRLMFSLPANLAPGKYQLTLETWFSTNNTQLKQSRTLVYALPLVVNAK